MSLGKLLATGRSLVGGAPGEGRYNISNANRLPKFGSAKNPFAPSATAEARVVGSGADVAPVQWDEQLQVEPLSQVERPASEDRSADMPEACPANSQVDCEAVDGRIAEFVRQSESACKEVPEESANVVGSVTLCAPSFDNPGNGVHGVTRPTKLRSVSITAVGWLKNFWRLSRAVIVAAWAAVQGFKWRASLQFCRSTAGALWASIRRTGPLVRVVWDKLKFILVKLAGLFRKRGQQEPKSVFPRFGKPAVQAELSLDSIKVMRNNLEESDLEIVTSDTRTGTQVAPTTPVALPKRGPVPAALKKMTGVIARH